MQPATQPPQTGLGHIKSFDGLRGVSVLVVMFHHGYLFLYGRGGFLGVDIFFVLSGFLITSLLYQEWERTGSISLKKFYSRRALRLLPALYTLLIVCLVKALLFPPAEGIKSYAHSILIVLFYLSNWINASAPLGPTWSLSIEEQFYIFWPIVLILMLKADFSRKRIVALIASAIVVVAIHRAWLFHSEYRLASVEEQFRVYAGTDTRIDALLVGCIAGLLFVWGAIPKGRIAQLSIKSCALLAIGSLTMMIVFIPIYSSYLYYGVFTLVAIATAIILVSLIQYPLEPIRRLLETRWLVWFGKLSYSLYIWHTLIYLSYDKVVPPIVVKSYTLRLFVPLAIKFILSVGVASFSYYLVERPFLRIKERHTQMGQSRKEQPVLLAGVSSSYR